MGWSKTTARQAKQDAITRASQRRKLGIPNTWLEMLQKPEFSNVVAYVTEGKNSDYSGLQIDLKDVEVWSDFITLEEIERLWTNDGTLRKVLVTRQLTETDKACVTLQQELLAPVMTKLHNEQSFELLWVDVQRLLNRILYVCATAKQGTDKPKVIWIGNGGQATKISQNAEPDSSRKKPDFASYRRDLSKDNLLPPSINNRIPGDAKLSAKISHDMLPPYGKAAATKRSKTEAKKVLSQIHGYMDRHGARYGYVVTDEELIFVRRRGNTWGQIDISPPIKHGASPDPNKGTLNSKYVLFYFHWVVANDDKGPNGWRMPSYGEQHSEAVNSGNQKVRKKELKTIRKRGSLLDQAKGTRAAQSTRRLR